MRRSAEEVHLLSALARNAVAGPATQASVGGPINSTSRVSKHSSGADPVRYRPGRYR
ncbi:MAG: hypothetical protein V3V57_15445 [Spirochaetia bacterium]